MKYNKEIAALQQIEILRSTKRLRGIKHIKRDKLSTQCERCFKWYHEVEAPDKQTIDGETIESDIVPLCQRCFGKSLKKERQRQFILGGISEGMTTEEEYKTWKISKPRNSKDFFEQISKGNRKLKRENTISDIVVQNKSFWGTPKFERECEDYEIDTTKLSEMVETKMKKLEEAKESEFLDDE